MSAKFPTVAGSFTGQQIKEIVAGLQGLSTGGTPKSIMRGGREITEMVAFKFSGDLVRRIVKNLRIFKPLVQEAEEALEILRRQSNDERLLEESKVDNFVDITSRERDVRKSDIQSKFNDKFNDYKRDAEKEVVEVHYIPLTFEAFNIDGGNIIPPAFMEAIDPLINDGDSNASV